MHTKAALYAITDEQPKILSGNIKEVMLDPLIYGDKVDDFVMPASVHEVEAVTNRSTAVKDETIQTPIPPEMDAKDKKDADEFEAILQRVREEHDKHRIQRRERRRQKSDADVAPKPVTTADVAPKPVTTVELLSTPHEVELSDLAREAESSQSPHICLLQPDSMDADLLHEWNGFCRLAADARMMHRSTIPDEVPPTARMLIINRYGGLMIVHDDWMRYLAHSGMLASMYVMSIFDQRSVLKKLEDLPPLAKVLVYDPESARCLDCMRRWKCDDRHFVVHLNHTPFPAACVVERRDEMLHVINI